MGLSWGLSLKFSAVDTWERHVETGKTREISFLVDYANLHYANLRKLHIALVAGFCYNIVHISMEKQYGESV